MRLSGIYGIIHQPTGRVYVGSSSDVFARWRGHVRALTNGRHINTALSEAWLASGPGAFSFVLIEVCNRSDLQTREQEWLDAFATVFNGTRTVKCISLDPRVGAKIGAALRGRDELREHGRRLGLSWKGRRRTPAQIDTQRQRLLGRKKSDEHRRHIIEAVNRPEAKAKHLANHWARSANAAEVIARIMRTTKERKPL